MTNKYCGEVSVDICGVNYTLAYGWREIAEIQTTLGEHILKSVFKIDPKGLATILHIGLQKHHSEISVEKILDLSPPILPIRDKIDQALALAYFGPEGAEKKSDKEHDVSKDVSIDDQTADEPAKKKTT